MAKVSAGHAGDSKGSDENPAPWVGQSWYSCDKAWETKGKRGSSVDKAQGREAREPGSFRKAAKQAIEGKTKTRRGSIERNRL